MNCLLLDWRWGISLDIRCLSQFKPTSSVHCSSDGKNIFSRLFFELFRQTFSFHERKSHLGIETKPIRLGLQKQDLTIFFLYLFLYTICSYNNVHNPSVRTCLCILVILSTCFCMNIISVLQVYKSLSFFFPYI